MNKRVAIAWLRGVQFEPSDKNEKALFDPMKEAMLMGADALEKQRNSDSIPKEPRLIESYCCPSCMADIDVGQKTCRECGQEIIWK